MDSGFFSNKKVTVFGLGLHGGGVGIVQFLAEQGARVIVTDIKTREQLKTSLEKLKGLKNVEYVLGQHRSEDFVRTDMVIKSPPIPWDNQHIALALKNNVPVEMDSSLFFKLCKNPIIGVTGTKGKTTTATMIYEILREAGKSPVRVGIGQISVLDRLKFLKKDSVAVFELSSWRLSGLRREKMSPHIAVITNILRDHMNYYRSMDTYIKDKVNIFLYQKKNDWLVVNNDDTKLQEISQEAQSQIIQCSSSPLETKNSVFIENGAMYLNNGIDAKKILELKDIKITGAHNVANMTLAAGAAYACGVDIEIIKKALVNFQGIPHRMEFVRQLNSVKFYNDTAATIPNAAMAALQSFTQPVVLIAGGENKNLDFAELGELIAKKVKHAVFLKGSATDELLEQVKKNIAEDNKLLKDPPVFDSMDKAVEAAYALASPGDAVLFSPGAASFNLFLNEFDRGDKFKEAVEKLQ